MPSRTATAKTEVVDIDQLTPDPANVRRHTDANQRVVSASVKRFGPARSLVLDRKNIVRAGNQTLKSAKAAGIKRVIVVEPEPDSLVAVRRREWSDTEATAYAIADNRSAELAEWDEAASKQINALISDGFESEEIGFESGADLLDDQEPADYSSPEDGELLARLKVTLDEPRAKVEHGEVWELGRHVLVVADVVTEPHLWHPHLRCNEPELFAPYPGPFVPLCERASRCRIVMVQPDLWIAGHIIDHFRAAQGESAAKRITGAST